MSRKDFKRENERIRGGLQIAQTVSLSDIAGFKE